MKPTPALPTLPALRCFALVALLVLALALAGLALRAEQAAAPPPPDLPGSAARYAVLLAGNRAGVFASWTSEDGLRHYFFEFNDRGRGPRLETKMRVGEDGIPTFIHTAGHDYFKGPVEERFSLEDGRAAWKNKAEQGEKRLDNAAFYISLNGAEDVSSLVRALLKAPGAKLALLPEGEARLVRVRELSLEGSGETRAVGLYTVAGIGFEPFPVWLDADQNLFATASRWLTVIREGWEESLEALLEAQDEAAAARQAALAKKLPHVPAGPLVIRGATLFDAETASLRPGTTVVVSGNRIVAVGPEAEAEIPEGAEVIEAEGKTLLPGLWDMHVHIDTEGTSDGLLHLAAGVTTVRDLANDTEKLLETKAKFESGAAVGPRVIAAGFLDGPGPFQGPTKVLVDTEAEARAAIDNYAELGFVQIKIYSSIKPELVPAIVAQARKRGLRLSGHIPAFMTAEQAVRLGFDEIQHINMLFLNFLFDQVQDTRTPARFTAVAEHGADIDPAAENVQAFIQLLKERKVVVDPTVAIFETMFTDRPGSVGAGFAAVADRLPPQVRRALLTGGLPVPEGKDERYRDSFRSMLRLVGALHRAGIPIVAGTDSLAGFTLHRELELYVEAGIPAPQVLQLATLGAARVMKRDEDLGSVTAGKLADLILVDGNPAANISDIRRVVTVVKHGVVYQSAALYEALGVRP